MKQPIRVMFSTLGNRFYAFTKYKMQGDTLIVTGEKFDVTDDIARAIKKYDLEFTALRDSEAK
jgi:hypothetical protein